MRMVLLSTVALMAAACVGDKAELGGVDNRMAPPAAMRACNLEELKVVQRGQFRFPEDAMIFAYMSKDDFVLERANVKYDITEAGLPVNIAYAGPEADMRHATKQKVIRAAVDAVKETRYQWLGSPAFATGCLFNLKVGITVSRDPA